LISILKKNSYNELIIFFDGGGEYSRRKILPEYKSNRTKMDDDLFCQMKLIKEMLKSFEINYFEMRNCEADDLIATFVDKKIRENKEQFFDIFTRDKDLLQLINSNVRIIKYENKKIVFYDEQAFKKTYNFSPPSFVDYLSILGDSSDNIKGVNGIGLIGAKKIISEFESLEQAFKNMEKLGKRNRDLLECSEDLVYKNRSLIELKRCIAFPGNFFKNNFFNLEKLENNFSEFNQKLKKLFFEKLD
jgi:DNA polymerase-1